MKTGPKATEFFERFGYFYQQGEHTLISGKTGSGKTVLARRVMDARLHRQGHVVLLVSKLNPDATIKQEFGDFQVWSRWRRLHLKRDNKVVLWPNTSGLPYFRKLEIQRNVFKEFFELVLTGLPLTVVIDDGLWVASKEFLGLEHYISALYFMVRSGGTSMTTLIQRPSHMPLIVYSNATHFFAGRTNERVDKNRLAELNPEEGSKELSDRLSKLSQHDFLYVPQHRPTELINLSR